MSRNIKKTIGFMSVSNSFRFFGTKLATNIIIDYKDFKNSAYTELYTLFDYVSWNPYWDGKWDRDKAEKNYKYYFGG